ncbi:MAG: hypothetical protein QM820_06155 [Minicystis sp.]
MLRKPAPPSLRTLGIVAAALAVLAEASAVAQSTGLKLVNRLWGVGEVQYVATRGTHVLERWGEPHAVRQAEVSSDGRFAYVWHHGAKPPLELSIYDLTTRSRTATFKPGAGGTMFFTPDNTIFHWWGCGTNCAVFALYDVNGHKVIDGGTSQVEISPTRRFLLTGPSLFAASESVALYDLGARGRKLFETRAALSSTFTIKSVSFGDDTKAVIALQIVDQRDKTLRLVIDASNRKAVKASFPDGEPRGK